MMRLGENNFRQNSEFFIGTVTNIAGAQSVA
jgi:hypothetical protein